MVYIVFGAFILAFLAMLLLFIRKTLFSVHMLQQSGYRNSDYLKWCDDNLMRNISVAELVGMGLSLVIFFLTERFMEDILIGFVNCIITMAVVSIGLFPLRKHSTKKAKKPLVYTARVKRLLVTCFLQIMHLI